MMIWMQSSINDMGYKDFEVVPGSDSVATGTCSDCSRNSHCLYDPWSLLQMLITVHVGVATSTISLSTVVIWIITVRLVVACLLRRGIISPLLGIVCAVGISSVASLIIILCIIVRRVPPVVLGWWGWCLLARCGGRYGLSIFLKARKSSSLLTSPSLFWSMDLMA